MRRSLLLSALFVAATLLACDEDPIAPPMTGSLTLRIIMGTEGPQQAAVFQTAAPAGGANTAPGSSTPRAEFKTRRSELDAESARAARIEPAQPGQVPTLSSSSSQPAAAPASPAAIDAATIHIIGPTNRTLTGQTPGSTVTIDGLLPGSYTVVLLGLVGGPNGALDYFGQTSVTVVAGDPRTATITFTSFRPVVNNFTTPSTNVSFEVTFPAVAGADSYIVQFDTNTAFATPVSGSVPTPFAVATVADTGTYYVRARAVNTTYASTGGSWGSPKAVRVVDDRDPSGPDHTNAFDLGFGAAANATLTELNILPAGDEDWFSVELCLGDMIAVETRAQRHTPPSGLDSYVQLYNAIGLVLVAENDDIHADTLDSRLQTMVGTAGTYYLRVFGPYQNSLVGQYDLSVVVTEGSGHSGGTCSTLPGTTNGWTGAGDGTSWSVPGNWLTGLPTPTDVVSIPATASPVLSENVTIAGLVVAPGGHVETNGFDLTVTGDLAAGNSITGSGTVILTGTGVSMSGGVPNLSITGDVSLAGRAFATGNVQVAGILRMNGHQMAVGGTFGTINSNGVLEMLSDADTLAVAGLAMFSGGSTAGRLTAGKMILGGGIRAQTVSPTFAPTGSHGVVMAGAADRAITDVVGLSFFNNLALQTTGTVTVAGVAGQVQVNGRLMSEASVTPVVTGGDLLVRGVAVQNMVLDNSTLVIGNGAITALDGVVFRNFAAGTQQLIVNRDGGSHTFNNLRFSQANGASDVYIEARDANTGDGDPLTINLAAASPADGSPGITSLYYGAVVNWVAAQAGPPAQVSFTVQPSNVTAGAAIAPAIEVTIQDASTITVDTSTANVTIALNNNPGGGTLSGTTTVAAVNGVATFSDLSIEKAGVGYTLIAYSPGLTSEASSPFTVTGGTPTTLLLESGDYQTAAPDVQLPDPLAVKVVDGFGNGVPGVDVTWTVTQGDGVLSAGLTTTNASGIATVAFTLGSALGTHLVEASAAGLAGSPMTFTATAANVVRWANAAGGNWSVGTNWEGGSPPASDEVAVIDINATFTVTADVSVNVEGIIFGGSGGSQRLEADGVTITASGPVRIAAGGWMEVRNGTLNASSLNVVPGSSLSSFTADNSTVNAPVDNGAQLIARGTTTFNGEFTETSAVLLLLGDGADVTIASGFTNTGIIEFASESSGGYPSLYVDTGTLVNAVGGKIIFSGLGGGYFKGNLDNRDSLKVQSAEAVTLTGSTISNSGVMLAAGADLNVDAALTNTGTITIADSRTFGSYGAGFGNAASGQVIMGANATLDLTNTTTTFETGYTVRGTRSIWIDGTGATSPSVTLGGTLVVETGGTLGIKSNTLTVDSLVNGGAFTLDVAHVVGPVNNIGSLTATVGGNSVTGNLYSATDAWLEVAEPGAELVVTGDLTNHGTIKLSSTTAGTQPKLQVTGGTLTHYQWFDSDGPAGGLVVVDSMDNQGELHAVAGGVFTVDGPAIFNRGSFHLTDADFTVSGIGLFVNAGSITINNGRKFVRSGGNFENPGQIFGNGTLDVLVTNFTSTGAINPGASPGTLNFTGNVTLVSGDLYIEIDGKTAGQYDVLTVSGAASLAGVLAVTQNITPVEGDTFTVMTYGSRTGQFTSATGLEIGGGLALNLVYSATDLKLAVGAATASVRVTPSGASLSGVGSTVQLSAAAYDSEDNLLTSKTFTWTSLNANVATVSASGLVTAVANGQVIIQAQVDGVRGYAVVTVADPALAPVTVWAVESTGVSTTLFGVWGTAPNNVYAVGYDGNILRFNGTTWSEETSNTSQHLYSVWGSSGSDVYAASPSVASRYDGTTWSNIPGLSGWQLWGAAPNLVLGTTSGGVQRYDGSAVTFEPISNAEGLLSAWGAGANDIWTVGWHNQSDGLPTVFHFDGAGWTEFATGATQPVTDVWGSASGDVYVVGGSGQAPLHWNGSSWSSLPSWPISNNAYVSGSSASEVFVVDVTARVHKFDGTSWTTASLRPDVRVLDIWASPGGDVFGVGDFGSETYGATIRGYRGATVEVSAPTNTLTGVGVQVQLTATAKDAANNTIPEVSFTWSSSNEAAATVDANGLVTAVGQGSTTITATAPGGASDGTAITVQIPTTLEITPGGVTLNEPGSTTGITPQLLDADGAPISGQTYTLSSLNTNIATVNSGTGTVTAVANGQVAVSAESHGITGYALITVTQSPTVRTNAWSEITSPSVNFIMGLWGTSATNVYAAGYSDRAVFHYDGNTWTTATTTTNSMWSVWGSSAADVFAVGEGGEIWHYDGGSWSTMSSGTTNILFRVWGTGPNDVFAVGAGGTILRYNGTSWAAMTSGTPNALYDVWGTASNNLFAVGGGGILLHWNGTEWTAMTSGTTNDLYGVWGTSPSEVFVAGNLNLILRYNGSTWSPMTTPSGSWLWSVWGTSSNEVFAVGGSNNILQYNGSTWTSMPTTGDGGQFRGMWGFASGDILAVGQGQVFKSIRGATAVSLDVAPTGASVTVGSTRAFTAVPRDASGNPISYETVTWSSLNTRVATINSSGVATAEGDGQAIMRAHVGSYQDHALITVSDPSAVPINVWTTETIPTTAHLYGIWEGESDAFAVGQGAILHYDGIEWTNMTSPTTLTLWAVWGSSETDVFAVGEQGTIAHYNGSSWSLMTSGVTVVLYRVWGTAPNDVFAVGSTGTILHYDGAAWSPMNIGVTTSQMSGVWGTASDDVYAVGTEGAILRYDGTSWNPMVSNTTDNLRGVWGTSSSDVFVVGSTAGIITHWNGSSWTAMSNPSPSMWLWGTWGSSSGDVYAVGSTGTILRYDGASWHDDGSSGTTSSLRNLTGSATGHSWAVGSGGAIRRGVRGAAVANFGNAVSFGYINSWSANYLFGYSVTVTDNIELTHLALISDSVAGNVKIGLYTDNGGNPDALIVQGTASISRVGANEIRVNQTTLSPGTYWIMYVSDATLPIRAQVGTSKGAKYVPHTYANPLPANIVSPSTFPDQDRNYYVRGFVIPATP